MSDGRCRACGAAVTPNAAWCSLCYADLRHPVTTPAASTPAPTTAPSAPAPMTAAQAREQIAVAPTAAAAMQATVAAARAELAEVAAATPTGDTLTAAQGLQDTPERLSMAAPATGAAAGAAALAPKPTWPCPRCEAKVSMDLDACDSCGAGFLSGAATSKAVRLPIVGDVTRISSGQRLVMGVGIAIGIMVIIVALAALAGYVF